MDDVALPTTALAIAFAPCGAILRFRLGALLNPKNSDFMLGTFAANLLGSLIAACIAIALSAEGNSAVTIAILSAAGTGFTGATTSARLSVLFATIWFILLLL